MYFELVSKLYRTTIDWLFTSLVGNSRDAWQSKTMKSAILFPYEALNARGCCRLHARHAAITSAIYTLVSK
jgi:hypothetical protein